MHVVDCDGRRVANREVGKKGGAAEGALHGERNFQIGQVDTRIRGAEKLALNVKDGVGERVPCKF